MGRTISPERAFFDRWRRTFLVWTDHKSSFRDTLSHFVFSWRLGSLLEFPGIDRSITHCSWVLSTLNVTLQAIKHHHHCTWSQAYLHIGSVLPHQPSISPPIESLFFQLIAAYPANSCPFCKLSIKLKSRLVGVAACPAPTADSHYVVTQADTSTWTEWRRARINFLLAPLSYRHGKIACPTTAVNAANK